MLQPFPSLFCFHQHLVISSFNYSPAFFVRLLYLFIFSKTLFIPRVSIMDLNAVHITSLFLHTHANPSAVSGSSRAWCFHIRLKDVGFKYLTVLSTWRNVISKDLYFSCTQEGPMRRILRQFLPNYFSFPYVRTLCNSTPIGHLHPCWQQQSLYHWVQDQPREKHQECAFHSLFTDEYTVQGTLPESEISKAPVHISSYCQMSMLLKKFLSYFQTLTRLVLKLIKSINHASSNGFRCFTYRFT